MLVVAGVKPTTIQYLYTGDVVVTYSLQFIALVFTEALIGDVIVVTNLTYDLSLPRNCESDYKVWNCEILNFETTPGKLVCSWFNDYLWWV